MRGRPRDFDRDEALDVAVAAFWRHGYAQTTVGQLTKEMGINPPSLYAAFGSKDQLFLEASERYLVGFRQRLAESLELPTARESVTNLLEATVDAHTDPATPAGCLVLTEPRLREHRRWMVETIAERLRRAQEEGDLAVEVDADELAAFIGAVISGMSDRARDGDGRERLAAIARITIDSFPGPGMAGK